MISYAAVHKAGAVAVPTNTRLTPSELRTILGHAGISAVITSTETLPSLTEVRALPSLQLIVNIDGRSEGTTDIHDVARPGRLDVPGTGRRRRPRRHHVHVGHDGAAEGRRRSPSQRGHDPQQRAGVVTGQLDALVAAVHLRRDRFIYNPMKMGMGGLYQAKFDAGRWLDVRRARSGRRWPSSCRPWRSCSSTTIGFARRRSDSLTLLSIGSAPLPPETLLVLLDRLPDASVSNSYGMTEAGPAFCVMPEGRGWSTRVGSVGIPMQPMEIRIVDPEGEDDRPIGEHGEVLIRSKGREREYYNDPEATAAHVAGRRLAAHRRPRVSRRRRLPLHRRARIKDVIIRGGNNIYATDVEAVLLRAPGGARGRGRRRTARRARRGRRRLRRREAGCRARRPTTLLAFCAERLADYKVPRRIEFLDELPRNATGKVLKNQLKEQGWHSTN